VIYSPDLKRFFSHPFLLFLGSVSVPLYLLHRTLIRGPLAFAYFKLLPTLKWINATEENIRLDHDGVPLIGCNTVRCMVAALGIFRFWFLGLIILAVIWRNYIDLWAISIAFLVQEVFCGTKSVPDFLNVMEEITPKFNEKQA